MSTFTYIKSFFRDKDVASVTPTSRFCIEHVCRPVDFSKDITVVEYGAGAGVFAGYLLNEMSPRSALIMFETNERMFKKLQEIVDPRVHLHNKSVEFVDKILDDKFAGEVDYIISGIPFSFLKETARQTILQKSKEILKRGGQFLAYQTSGHLREPLQEIFGNVQTEWELRNIPPMTIYKAVKDEG